jgi:hypothetical protein
MCWVEDRVHKLHSSSLRVVGFFASSIRSFILSLLDEIRIIDYSSKCFSLQSDMLLVSLLQQSLLVRSSFLAIDLDINRAVLLTETYSESLGSYCSYLHTIISLARYQYCCNLVSLVNVLWLVSTPHIIRSVAARALQRSHWPTLLQSDSVKTHAVRKDVVFLTWVISVMGALTAIAGIVTPLGLYQALLPDDPVSQSFNFIKDNSPFGLGTPDRSNLSFTRICGYYPVIPCPFTDTVAIIERNATDGTIDFPYGYDINMPAKLEEIFSSGTDDTTTVSNYFDIQWRRYQTTTDELFNNGSRYLVGAFRPMQSLALDNSLQPVEGLVVDMVNGGIGFRNHTVPPGFEFGVTWEEDLLFIEPETACADTNTTLDYKIAASPNATATIIIDLVLTDRGGFVNLNHTYPDYNMTAPQTNADLAKRAYKAAWLVNAYTMLYYNITNMANQTLGTHAFRYVNSAINKTFQVPVYSGQANYYTSLGMDPSMDFHLYFNGSIANTSSPADSGPPSNPFNVDDTYFNEIGMLLLFLNHFIILTAPQVSPAKEAVAPTTQI